MSVRDPAEQGGLPGIRIPDQPHVGHRFQLKDEDSFFARFPWRPFPGCLARGGHEMTVAQPAPAASGYPQTIPMSDQLPDNLPGLMIVNHRAEGNEKHRFSLLEAFENSEFADVWRESGRTNGDIFHTNSIELLDGSVADANPAFAAGNLLISVLHLNAIAVVDPEREKVVWVHTGGYRQQHDPKILPNGNLLLFDNGTGRPQEDGGEYSRAIELALDEENMTAEAVWTYRHDPDLFCPIWSDADRLPNGNTLVVFGTRSPMGPFADSPETGDDLIVAYVDSAGGWHNLTTHLGSEPDMTEFEQMELQLPADAYHAGFRIRWELSARGPF